MNKIPKLNLNQISFANNRSKSSSRKRSVGSSSRIKDGFELVQKIEVCDKKIEKLYSLVQERNNTINQLILNNKVYDMKKDLENLKFQYAFIDTKYFKEIDYLKIKLNKKQQSTISLSAHEQILNSENLKFKNKKLILLDKLIEKNALITKFTNSDRMKINNFINDSSFSLTEEEDSANAYENYVTSQTPEKIHTVSLFKTGKFLN